MKHFAIVVIIGDITRHESSFVIRRIVMKNITIRGIVDING